MSTIISGDTGIDKITDGSVVQADLASGITVDSLSTASGSAPSYSARAWVNFNGTGTVAIRDSGNVSSITDNGTGNYTVNFTTAMPDVNYCISASGQYQGGSGNSLPIVNGDRNSALSTISCVIGCNDDAGGRQDGNIFVAIFR